MVYLHFYFLVVVDLVLLMCACLVVLWVGVDAIACWRSGSGAGVLV
jgi:hypothetical protein